MNISIIYNLIRPELYTESLAHFKENYYPNAELSSHLHYIQKIYEFKKNNGRYPSRQEFFLFYQPFCFCEYSPTTEEYLESAEFFISQIGTLRGLDCIHFYTFKQFRMLEGRSPVDSHEFFIYLQQILLIEYHPEIIFQMFSSQSDNPVERSKIEQLKSSVFACENEENCSICQEAVEKKQMCLKLECGHYFHSEDSDCCGGSIFKWFETNRTCPTCRHEIY